MAPLWKQLKEQAPDGRVHTRRLLEIFGVTRPSVDVDKIARDLGVLVHPIPNPGWAGAVRSTGERADIWIRKEDAPVRQRFTLAHELGHLFLQPGLDMEFRDTTFAGGAKEIQANRFAADLLMPLWMVAEQAERLGYSSTRLAALFAVSAQAMGIRLGKLGVG